MELHFLADIASTISQNFLLLKLKYFEKCYDNDISYSIFHVFCRCQQNFVNNIFYVTPQKKSHEVKSGNRGSYISIIISIIEYIYNISPYPFFMKDVIEIFHHNTMRMAHHLAATIFFVE